MVNTLISKNATWTIGSVVKIGFLKLRVVDYRKNEEKGLPGVYTLENLDSTKKYEFTPHYGLKKI